MANNENHTSGNEPAPSEAGVLNDISKNAVFEHFLITRFNIPLNFTNKTFDDETLRERVDLFEKFCYPSVASQTNKQFKWIVLFDRNSPSFLRERIEHYKLLSNFIPVFGECYSRKYIREVISEHLSDSVEYLITSRLDNDDAICRDYIHLVQQQFDRQESLAVNLLNGYRWKDGKVYWDRFKSNQIISLIELIRCSGPDGFDGVYFKQHGEIQSSVPTINLKTSPAWMITIHGKNLASRLKGLRVSGRKVHEHFALDASVLKESETRIECCYEFVINIFQMVYFRLSKKIRRLMQMLLF